MPVLVVDLAVPPDVCWRALTDASQFAAWMPGLRRAEVISSRPDGLPHEVSFEFSATLSYSLVYTYDVGKREVRWEPHTGARDAVRGFARIDAHGAGARMTYKVEQGAHRAAGDLVRGGAHPVIGAFVRWLEAQHPPVP